MIKKNIFVLVMLPLLLTLFSCGKEIDDEYPEIHLDFAEAFPLNCDTVFRGETFIFKARFTDNEELGSFSLDVHHNFNHHTHSTEELQCALDSEKEPTENVFLLMQGYEIPAGLTEYYAEVPIEIPENADTGDYDLYIFLTDKSGWQSIHGLGIKILERNE